MKLSVIYALFSRKKFREALSYINAAHGDLSPEVTIKSRYYQVLCLIQIKDYPLALEILDLVISSNLNLPYLYQCRMLKAYIYTELEQNELAKDEFKHLLAAGYESSKIYAALGHVEFVLGFEKEAEECLIKSLAIDVHNPTALNSYAYLLAERDSKRSLKMIQEAVKSSPQNPVYLDTLGVVYMHLGLETHARKVLSLAYRLYPHPTIKDHLSMLRKEEKA